MWCAQFQAVRAKWNESDKGEGLNLCLTWTTLSWRGFGVKKFKTTKPEFEVDRSRSATQKISNGFISASLDFQHRGYLTDLFLHLWHFIAATMARLQEMDTKGITTGIMDYGQITRMQRSRRITLNWNHLLTLFSMLFNWKSKKGNKDCSLTSSYFTARSTPHPTLFCKCMYSVRVRVYDCCQCYCTALWAPALCVKMGAK